MPDTNKAQAWDSCDEDIRKFVLDRVDTLKNQLCDNLVGIYLHGSVAMGSYYRPKSDIDLIVVIQNKIGAETAKNAGIAVTQESSEIRCTFTGEILKQMPFPDKAVPNSSKLFLSGIKFSPDGKYLLISYFPLDNVYSGQIQLCQLQ